MILHECQTGGNVQVCMHYKTEAYTHIYNFIKRRKTFFKKVYIPVKTQCFSTERKKNSDLLLVVTFPMDDRQYIGILTSLRTHTFKCVQTKGEATDFAIKRK